MHSNILLPAFVLLSATGAHAQIMPYPPTDSAPLTSVQVSAPAKAARIRPAVAKQIVDAYEMSNGWYLRVMPSPRYIETIIDDQPPMRLVATAPYRFVSGDGNVTMEFNLGGSGEEMRMTYVPDRLLGQRIVIESRFARR